MRSRRLGVSLMAQGKLAEKSPRAERAGRGVGGRERKEITRETSGSLGTEAPSHLQPLWLWCPKQPPRSSRGCRTADGGSPRGAPPSFADSGSPRGVPFPADPPPGSPFGVPGGAHRVRPCGVLRWSGTLSDPRGSSLVPRVQFTFRCSGRSSGPLASTTSTAWSEAKDSDGLKVSQLRVPAGQTMNAQVDGVNQSVTNR
jgi:hypothetical protein